MSMLKMFQTCLQWSKVHTLDSIDTPGDTQLRDNLKRMYGIEINIYNRQDNVVVYHLKRDDESMFVTVMWTNDSQGNLVPLTTVPKDMLKPFSIPIV